MNTLAQITRRRFLILGCGVAAGALCAGCSGTSGSSGTASSTSAAVTSTSGDASPAPEAGALPASDSGESACVTTCPHGLVNDPYPGECRHYRDADGNGYCDLSECA